MSKIKIIAIIVLLLGLAGAGYVYTQSRNSETQTQETSQQETQDELSFTGKLTELLILGRDIQCDFNYTDDAGATDGTVYMADGGKKLRGNFVFKAKDGSVMDTSVIQNDGVGYFWGTGMPQGYKMELDTDKSILDSVKDASAEFDSDAIMADGVDYDCKTWRVDNDLLTPPTNIEFYDMSQTLNQLNEVYGDDLQCSICNSLPEGSDRQSCQAAFCKE